MFYLLQPSRTWLKDGAFYLLGTCTVVVQGSFVPQGCQVDTTQKKNKLSFCFKAKHLSSYM